jgi:hypothetical protein
MQVVAKKISKKSVFKVLVIGLTTSLSLFGVLCAIAALFGAETIQWNGEYKTGIEGLLYGLLIGPTLGLFFACIMWLFIAPGLWMYSFIRPLRLTFKHGEMQ